MSRGGHQRGAASIYVLLLLVFVIFSFLVMAVDVGRLYLVQAELQTAAEAGALAAATRLWGTASSDVHAGDQVTTAFDTTTGNENRFNLRISQLGVPGTDLVTEILVDYFSTLADAQVNTNGGQSGADAKYARVEVRAETPVLFTRFLSPDREPRQRVAAAAVAGLSSPVCTACGIEALAVVPPDTTDEENYGFAPGEYYTLYLTPSQQRPNLPACPSPPPPPPMEGTSDAVVVEYILLNHIAAGPETDLDGELFRLAAGAMANTADLDPPGSISIGSEELAKPDLQGATCPEANSVGRDFLCGLNTRFGVDPAENACASIEGASDLAALYPADSDVGTADADSETADTLQNYAVDYDGNLRRVLTVTVVDAADTLSVLNFRQFLIENSPTVPGVNPLNPNPLNPGSFTGAFRAQYIGRPVPLRCGGVGGSCSVAFGVGRTVLH